MAEINTIKTVDREPFKWFTATIGNLPTSFVDSMSYYEVIAKICEYLENEIIPTLNLTVEEMNVLRKDMDDLKAYVDGQLSEIPKLREEFEAFTTHIEALIDKYQDDIEDYVNDELVRFRTDIQLVLNQMNTALNNKLDVAIDELNDKIDNIVVANVVVFNASLGEYQTLQETLDYLFNYQRTEALTAKEYDDLELTAKGYDDNEITAYDYDNFGKTILTNA